MSVITSSEEEKYVNGCRSSGSLLELQPFKVVITEPREERKKVTNPRRHLQNNNNRHKDTRTHSSPGFDDDKVEQKQPWELNEMPLLAANTNDQSRNGTTVSCNNIFNSTTSQVKPTPDNGTTGQSPKRSPEYNPLTQGNSLPKPIIRTPSQERLLTNESPNHVSTEQKKTKPRKPNRESLRRSRPDIRASQPNLPTINRSSVSLSGSPEHISRAVGGQSTSANHDYEELPTDVKILQQRKISHPQTETPVHRSPSQVTGFTPITFQSQASPAIPERTKNPRQRLNPLYAGMHMNPYEQQVPNGTSTQKRPPAGCIRCLIAGVIIAVIFSILSVAVTALMVLGYLDAIKISGFSGQDSYQANRNMISRLQSEILALRNASNQTNIKIDERLENTKLELIQAVKDLNISALKGPSTTDVAKCVHKTFGIGSSSSRDEITSGEYFAEKGFVTTGVTCSASSGYVAYLRTREEDVEYSEDDDDPAPMMPRVIYKCMCHKSPSLALPSPRDRVECSIHYWQCPVL